LSVPTQRHPTQRHKPDITAKLAAAYDKWWDELYPTLIQRGGDKGSPEPLGGKSKE
jgi:hypothetical protein